jgi:hypothetical protein
VAVFLDQSESMTQARLPQVSAESLVPLLERLKVDGGEVAVGLIRDRSDAPLTRVFVPALPSPPVFPARASSNIFEKAQQRKREEAERTRYEEQLSRWPRDARWMHSPNLLGGTGVPVRTCGSKRTGSLKVFRVASLARGKRSAGR